MSTAPMRRRDMIMNSPLSILPSFTPSRWTNSNSAVEILALSFSA